MLRMVLIWGLLLLSGAARSEPVSLPTLPQVALDEAVVYLEDTRGEMTVDDVRRPDTRWDANGDSAFNRGYSNSVWWLRLQLHNPGSTELKRLLELAYAVLDRVDVHVYSGQQLLDEYQLGDLLPHRERPVDSRFFLLPLHWQPDQTLEIYFRIQTASAVQAPLTLWEPDAYYSHENFSNIAQGLYYGGLVVIAVYNLLIFLVLWERSYLYYVGFILSVPMFMAAISGQGFRYLWPDAVVWNDHAIPFLLGSTFMFAAMFSRRFLQVEKWSVWACRMLLAASVCAGSFLVLAFLLPYQITIRVLVPLGLFTILLCMAVGVMAQFRKVPNARHYLVAWGAFLCGGLMFALNKLGVLPANFTTEYSMQIGSLLEAVLLSFAMAERINVERRLRFEAQDEALQATRRLNEELEQRVQERTQELENLNQRLAEISNTDQLTGLRNRRYLDQALEEEWQRSLRYRHSLCVLLLDIDFFKKVNDEHGHLVGDACLKQVAERISNCGLRATDLAARYGGEEFCLVLAETTLQGGLAVAERIRAVIAATPLQADSLKLSVTVSIGVHCGVPQDADSVEQWLHHADVALYAAKENGRNRVMAYRPETLCKIHPLSSARKN